MSCLFESLGRGLSLSASDVRRQICNYLEQNPNLYQDDYVVVDSAYVERMRKHSTWGGGIEIRAACLLYGISVHVHVVRRGNADSGAITFLGNGACRDVHLNWTGNHYTYRPRE